MNKANDRFKNVSTKVSSVAFDQLHLIADRLNLKVYNLLQFVIDSYLKYFSDEVAVTDETKMVIADFGGISLAKNGFTLCNPPRHNIKAQSCIMIFEKKGVSQTQPLLLKNSTDGLTANMNVDSILCALLSAIAPELLEMLSHVKKENHLISLGDSMKFAIRKACIQEYDMTADIKELFSDNERSEWGIKPHEGAPYKRTHTHNIETM